MKIADLYEKINQLRQIIVLPSTYVNPGKHPELVKNGTVVVTITVTDAHPLLFIDCFHLNL